MKILPLLGQDECGLCVCTRTLQHGEERAKGRGREKKTSCPPAIRSRAAFISEDCFPDNFRSAKDHVGSALQSTQNIPDTQKHRVNKLTTNL